MSNIPWKMPRTAVSAVDRILSEIGDRLRRRFAEVDTDLAGKSDTGHTHDDRYYTEAEVDSAVGAKQDSDASLDDFVGLTPSAGDMIYWNGTHWVLIDASSALDGQVLTFNQSSSLPYWADLP
jgi:hypothetical protein